ncbi:efflux RND transporter periplasmic adaptor subunit [Marinilabilia rubra]|uniref:Efflux RND transporter periplasmic adaptor subunit n=1 Tax=Marinilabilia rubra TaxID=2162893 RepID=A0A2U2B555_9BACT|nr:efflux RND transporter periplasmic adaptor subunit [Marinilabilia rubra]PWD98200.1 efflux RND transporter periplasmic adaptor subunit [Marinilabilia rubra]
MMNIQSLSKISGCIVFAGFISMMYSCGGSTHQEHDGHNAPEHLEAGNEEDLHSGHNHEAGSLAAEKEELEENQVLVTHLQMENVGIQTGHPTKEHLSNLVKAFGNVTLPPSYEASVSPFVGGEVTDIGVIEGDYVRKGQVLAFIEHPDILELQRNYLEARNLDKYLKNEYERQSRLLKDSVNAARTVQKAESEYQNNLARLQSLKRELELVNITPSDIRPENLSAGYPILAPISGYVASVMVNTGIHVPGQKEIFHIADNENAHLDLMVFEKDIAAIKSGQNLTFNLANNSLATPLRGVIRMKSSRFDTESRTALVHADIEEMHEGVLPGMAVTAWIQTGGKAVWALPEEAVVQEQGKSYVFRLIEGEEHDHEAHSEENSHEDHSEEHDHEAHAEGHNHDHSEGGHANEEEGNHEEFMIFERIEVTTGLNEGGFVEIELPDNHYYESGFAVENAQALLSEMKKGGAGGHSGHNH